MDTPPRRAYERPRLIVYGDLRVVTQANITMAMNDPGHSSVTMT